MRSDFELLDAWRAGDLAAGNDLVQRYWTSIARFVTSKIIGDDGADLISQIFLACVEGRDRIDGDNVRAYLFATARRRLADHFRKRARMPELAIETMPSVMDLGTGVATALDREQRGELLRAALVRIPLDDQIALELAYFEQLSTRELAGVLEVPEPTVRSRLSRARDKLRERLAELGTVDEARAAESQLQREDRE